MYDLAQVRWATDALWAAIAEALTARGIAAPATLDRRADHASAWTEPGLVLSQACGYPFATRLRGRVRLVAVPTYRAQGCERARYRSLVFVRAGDPARCLADLRFRRVAYNARDSQSGYNALRAMAAPLAVGGRFFSSAIATGSHAASLAAVHAGQADVCAVDCVAWALLARHEPTLAGGLRCIGRTPTAPGLPFVTSAAADEATVAALRSALREALSRSDGVAVRDALLLDGFAEAVEAEYDEVLEQERRAAALGYPELDGVVTSA